MSRYVTPLYTVCCVTIIFIMNCLRMFGWLAHFFHLSCLAGGIEYPNLSVCTCMRMVNPLCHYMEWAEMVMINNVVL